MTRHRTFVRIFLARLLALALLCSPSLLPAAQAAPYRAAIASAHPLATAAGMEVLRQGGNAFDAAVAVSAALAVVEPSGSGLTGGGLFLLHRAADGRDVVIDAREVAPLAATRDMYLDKDGNPIRGASTDTALAAGISGEPAGLAALQSQYGRLPLASSLAPAIKLARDGFDMYPRLYAGLARKASQFTKTEDGRRTFFGKEGQPLPVGTRLKQPLLARTLQTLANEGMQSFYTGTVSKQMLAGMRQLGGIWTEADLAAYKTLEREPIVDSVTRKHLIIEAERRVHRDRAVYLGDPAFTPVPVKLLLDPAYAAGLRTSIRFDRATPSNTLADAPEAAAVGTNTTHFSVLDEDGNRVAGTITLNAGFGTGLLVPGTGLLLNNQMDDFSIKPGVPNIYGLIGASANAIEPGKRMLSSVTPTFVEGPRGFMIVGSPGGSLITGMVLLATLDWIEGKSAEQIVAAPRIHHQYQPDVLAYEAAALTEPEVAALEKLGHKLRRQETWGNLQVVTYDAASGEVHAASDPRGVGVGGLY